MKMHLTHYKYNCRMCGHTHEHLVGSIINTSKRMGFRYDIDARHKTAFIKISIERDFSFEIQQNTDYPIEAKLGTVPIACPECGVIFLNSSFVEEQPKYPVSLSELPQWWVETLPKQTKTKLGL